jgi:hypothetical protein
VKKGRERGCSAKSEVEEGGVLGVPQRFGYDHEGVAAVAV